MQIQKDKKTVKKNLKRLGIYRRPYMFYPSNFWPHKNHRMLLTAYNMFLSKQPDNQYDLVFAGALKESEMVLRQEAKMMGLENNVHFLGYLQTDELTSVYQGCDFMIFPARYENNGYCLSHAMSFGKPILCSNIDKYRKIARKTATYFNPRKPDDIVRCIQKLTKNLKPENTHKKDTKKPSSDIATKKVRTDMMPFLGTTKTFESLKNKMIGRFKDGWTGEELIITYAKAPENRVLEIRLEVPIWMPYDSVMLELWEADKIVRTYRMFRENELTIRQSLSNDGGVLNLLVYPGFQPLEMYMEGDIRILGVLCRKAWIKSKENKKLSLIK